MHNSSPLKGAARQRGYADMWMDGWMACAVLQMPAQDLTAFGSRVASYGRGGARPCQLWESGCGAWTIAAVIGTIAAASCGKMKNAALGHTNCPACPTA